MLTTAGRTRATIAGTPARPSTGERAAAGCPHATVPQTTTATTRRAAMSSSPLLSSDPSEEPASDGPHDASRLESESENSERTVRLGERGELRGPIEDANRRDRQAQREPELSPAAQQRAAEQEDRQRHGEHEDAEVRRHVFGHRMAHAEDAQAPREHDQHDRQDRAVPLPVSVQPRAAHAHSDLSLTATRMPGPRGTCRASQDVEFIEANRGPRWQGAPTGWGAAAAREDRPPHDACHYSRSRFFSSNSSRPISPRAYRRLRISSDDSSRDRKST